MMRLAKLKLSSSKLESASCSSVRAIYQVLAAPSQGQQYYSIGGPFSSLAKRQHMAMPWVYYLDGSSKILAGLKQVHVCR